MHRELKRTLTRYPKVLYDRMSCLHHGQLVSLEPNLFDLFDLYYLYYLYYLYAGCSVCVLVCSRRCAALDNSYQIKTIECIETNSIKTMHRQTIGNVQSFVCLVHINTQALFLVSWWTHTVINLYLPVIERSQTRENKRLSQQEATTKAPVIDHLLTYRN